MLITKELFNSYLDCGQKAFLKLTKQKEEKSLYKSLHEGLVQILLKQYQHNLTRKHNIISLSNRFPLILNDTDYDFDYLFNVIISSTKYSGKIDALKRSGVKKNEAHFSLIPILVITTPKISKKHRIKLAFMAMMVNTLQTSRPSYGEIVCGKNLNTRKINISPYFALVENLIEKIYKISSNPPSFCYCKHCPICEYYYHCIQILNSNNHLSLLKGITDSEIKRMNEKGIFDINQLSYTYHPRKYKKTTNKSKRHNFALQALSIRENKIYVRERPEIPDANTIIYLDVEGDPDRKFYYLIGLIIITKGKRQKLSFWVDTEEKTQSIVDKFLDTLEKYDDFKIFHYGNYEKKFLEYLYINSKNRKSLIKKLIHRSVNILSYIYA